MSSKTYKGLVVSEQNGGTFSREIRECNFDFLPDHDVLVRVHYSALNYKDALSATGNKGVTQDFPHTPGVDAAGIVEQSDDKRFKPGDKVIVTSFDLGQNTPGGFGQYIRVPGDWIVPLPQNLSLRESMIYGTAGFTAAYGVHHIKHNETNPDDGPILVTGATGGVGSFAVSLLAKEGYQVTAATGKTNRESFLASLGASQIIHRDKVTNVPDKPLLSGVWAGALDTVGGKMLDAVLRQIAHNGTVACCGNVLGGELNTSIYPFILRGVSLMGIDSGICLMPMRKKIWNLLAGKWKIEHLNTIHREVTLQELNKEIDKILEGRQTGKVVVNLKNKV